MRKFSFFLVFLFGFIFAAKIAANVGVGVGTGKIVVDEPLHSGVVYQLPSLTVINTGDQTSTYNISISHREKQKELVADQSWLSFNPNKFELTPGNTQNVAITLTLPLRTNPGDYFVFLAAQPLMVESKGTQVGIAAASKLYFTVVPENFLYGVYYRLVSLWQYYLPWSLYLVVGILVLLTLLYLAKNFDLRIQKKPKKE